MDEAAAVSDDVSPGYSILAAPAEELPCTGGWAVRRPDGSTVEAPWLTQMEAIVLAELFNNPQLVGRYLQTGLLPQPPAA